MRGREAKIAEHSVALLDEMYMLVRVERVVLKHIIQITDPENIASLVRT